MIAAVTIVVGILGMLGMAAGLLLMLLHASVRVPDMRERPESED